MRACCTRWPSAAERFLPRLMARLAKLDLRHRLAPLRDAERRDLTEVIEDRPNAPPR